MKQIFKSALDIVFWMAIVIVLCGASFGIASSILKKAGVLLWK